MKLSKNLLISASVLTVLTVGGAIALANTGEVAAPVVEEKTEYVGDEKVTTTEMKPFEPAEVAPAPAPEPTPAPVVVPEPAGGKPSLAYAKAKALEAGQVSAFNSTEGRQAILALHNSYNLTNDQRICILGLHSQDLFLFKTVDLYTETLNYVMNAYGDPCTAATTFRSTGNY